jgi:hypothetical protein
VLFIYILLNKTVSSLDQIALKCWVIRESLHRNKRYGTCRGICLGRSSLCLLLLEMHIGPPLWSSGQSSWLDIQRSRVRFPAVVGLERGPLSLVSITEELRKWKSSGSGSRKLKLTAVRIRCADHGAPSIRKKLALTSPTNGGRSIGIVRLRTKVTELVQFRNVYQGTNPQ